MKRLCLQVTFERFTVGTFSSFLVDGCLEGEMQLWERDLPKIGGAWCGGGEATTSVYYSESGSLTIALTLRRTAQKGYNFDFYISYKMLPRQAAVVRYGGLLPYGMSCDHLHTEPQTDITMWSIRVDSVYSRGQNGAYIKPFSGG